MHRFSQQEKSKMVRECQDAVRILNSEGKKLTFLEIADLSGVPLHHVRVFDEIRRLVTPSKPTAKHKPQERHHSPRLAPYTPPSIQKVIPKIAVPASLPGYIKHITESYFFHPQTRIEARSEMQGDIADFDFELFHQAINLLIRDRVLVKHNLDPDQLVSTIEREKPTPLAIPAPIAQEREQSQSEALSQPELVEEPEAIPDEPEQPPVAHALPQAPIATQPAQNDSISIRLPLKTGQMLIELPRHIDSTDLALVEQTLNLIKSLLPQQK